MLRYGATVAAITAAVGLGLWLLRPRLGAAALRGAAAGTLLAAVAAVGVMTLTAWAFGKSQKVFFAALAAGILGRLALFGGTILVIALKRPPGLDLNATAAALLGLYVVFQILEIRMAAGRMAARRG